MSSRVEVDASRCEGHGLCVMEAPSVFEPDDDGYARVVRVEVDGADRSAANRAARACPAAAIMVGE